MEKCIKKREHSLYLIVIIARIEEYFLIQAGWSPCLNGNLRVTFDNNVRDVNDAMRYNDVHWCYEAQNSFQGRLIVGDKDSRSHSTWLKSNSAVLVVI